MATQAQIKKIHVLKKERGLTDEQYRTFLRDRYGVESSKDLSNRQASDFIEFLLQLGLSAAGSRLVPPADPDPELDDLLDDPEWTTLQRILAKLEGIETRLARLERLVERLESKSSSSQDQPIKKRKRPKIRYPDDPSLLNSRFGLGA